MSTPSYYWPGLGALLFLRLILSLLAVEGVFGKEATGLSAPGSHDEHGYFLLASSLAEVFSKDNRFVWWMAELAFALAAAFLVLRLAPLSRAARLALLLVSVSAGFAIVLGLAIWTGPLSVEKSPTLGWPLVLSPYLLYVIKAHLGQLYWPAFIQDRNDMADIYLPVLLLVGVLLPMASVALVAAIGTRLSGNPRVGLTAATLWACWPLLLWGWIDGANPVVRSQWGTEAWLWAYTEPLSTFLVILSVYLYLLMDRKSAPMAVLLGIAIGGSGLARPTNWLLGMGLIALLASKRRWSQAAWACATALVVFAPQLLYNIRYLGSPLRYGSLELGAISSATEGYAGLPSFSLAYVLKNWSESDFYHFPVWAVLVILVAVGAYAWRSARRIDSALLLWASANPLIYSFFYATAGHPRYLNASVPGILLLISGIVLARRPLEARRRGLAEVSQEGTVPIGQK